MNNEDQHTPEGDTTEAIRAAFLDLLDTLDRAGIRPNYDGDVNAPDLLDAVAEWRKRNAATIQAVTGICEGCDDLSCYQCKPQDADTDEQPEGEQCPGCNQPCEPWDERGIPCR